MKIAFNPSTVAALTSPPNNKDITFDLRGRNIFARGVKFYGTDTNTWRDIKVNNVSIGSHTLDLRNGSNTTLTNTNGVVTINSTQRPVVDNLTSDSTTSSLSANQGRVLAGLINGKSDSDHNHDGRYVRAFETSNDNIDSDWGQSFKTFDPIPLGTPPEKNPNISLLSIGENFNRRKQLAFNWSNDNIYYRRHTNGNFTNWRRLAFANEIPSSLKNPHALTISLNGTSQGPYDGSAAKNINITPGSIGAATSGHNHDDRYLKLTGGVLKGQIILPDIDVNTSYTGSIIIGASNTENLGIDGNEIMARNNGKASTLYLNNEGGAVQLGAILRTNSNIAYMGSQSTQDMIKFINNTSDSYGNGIAIGGGGLTIIGSGESSDVVIGQHSSGGDENMIIAGDGNIDFYSNLQDGWKYGKHMCLDTNGFLFTPSYINIGGNENNNSSPDRVWGSNSSDSFLRSYRTSALKVAYANSAGNANSANHATNADKLDGYHYNSFAPFNGVKFTHRPGDTTWHRILQFTTDWVGQVTFMYSPEECQRDYWGIFNINIRSKDIWFRGFSFANVPQIKCIGDNNNNWSVWVKGNTNSYDPYGVIQVLNYSNASIVNVGLDKSQTTEPSGTYNKAPSLFYAGFTDWNNIINKPSTFAPSAHTHKWTDITDRITKVSQLTNDMGYLTSHQSLANYYTKTEVNNTFVRAGNFESANLNSLDTYSFIKSVNSNVASASPNGNTGWYNVIQAVHRNGAADGPGYIGQIALGMTTNINGMFYRTKYKGSWYAWNEVVTTNTGLLRYSRNNVNISSPNCSPIPPSLLEWTIGYPRLYDPEFNDGYNNVGVYNNAGNGVVTVTRVHDTNVGNSSSYVMKVVSAAGAIPNYGGWHVATQTELGKVYTCLFRASIPSGVEIEWNSNSIGTGGQMSWLTNNMGTGKWTWYAVQVYCGSGGSTTFFFSAKSPCTWYLSYVNVIENNRASYAGLRSVYSDYLKANASIVFGRNELQYFNQYTGVTAGATSNANPKTNWYHILRMNHANNSGCFVDLAIPFFDNKIQFRRITNGSDNGWRRVITEEPNHDVILREASTDGNVGIGINNPAYKLDVNGQMRAEGFHHWTVNSDNYMLLAGGGYKSFGGDDSNPIFLGYLNLDHGNDGTVSSSFSCLGYSVPFTYTRGGNYCRIYIPDTTHQVFYIKAATASVNYSGGGMDTWVGYHRGSGAWWLHCYASGANEVKVKGFRQSNDSNDSWWGGNPLWSANDGANKITVCIFGYVKFR